MKQFDVVNNWKNIHAYLITSKILLPIRADTISIKNVLSCVLTLASGEVGKVFSGETGRENDLKETYFL